MAYFQTNNPYLGKFWRDLQWRTLVYIFCGHWEYFWPFGTCFGHLVYFMVICYIVWLFGTFSPVLVCCAMKNLATMLRSRPRPIGIQSCAHNEPLIARFFFRESREYDSNFKLAFMLIGNRWRLFTLLTASKATRWVCEKITQNVHIFCQINA
jgi:hypothetical protein